MLERLKAEYPGFNWPQQGQRRNYPEDHSQTGDIRGFGLKKFRLICGSSDESYATETVEQLRLKGTKALITYNPVKLETYGVWKEC